MTPIRHLIAAALLSASTIACATPVLGGMASDDVISAAGTDLAGIDYLAWRDSSAMAQEQPYPGPDPYPFVNEAFRLEKDSAVPEPLSVGLMGAGLLGLALARRRRR